MRSSLMAKISVSVHVALVAASVYSVTRIFNFTPLSQLPNTDTLAFSPSRLLAFWAGGRLLRGERASRVLAYGLALGAVVYAASLVGVMNSAEHEPLAPLWLIIVSLWLAAAYVVLLVAVWLMSRTSVRAP